MNERWEVHTVLKHGGHVRSERMSRSRSIVGDECQQREPIKPPPRCGLKRVSGPFLERAPGL